MKRPLNCGTGTTPPRIILPFFSTSRFRNARWFQGSFPRKGMKARTVQTDLLLEMLHDPAGQWIECPKHFFHLFHHLLFFLKNCFKRGERIVVGVDDIVLNRLDFSDNLFFSPLLKRWFQANNILMCPFVQLVMLIFFNLFLCRNSSIWLKFSTFPSHRSTIWFNMSLN